MRYLALILFVCISFTSTAEETGQITPATKMEAFQANTGIVVVRGYTTVGTLRGLGGNVSVDAREYVDASTQAKRVTGISISVKEIGRLERENTSFIDADEIDSLLQGLDYISRVSKEITEQENFEAEYRTKGYFRVTVFNESNGQLSLAISSGHIGKTSAYLKMPQLQELKQLILTAKSKL
jgi:hypothetical protein